MESSEECCAGKSEFSVTKVVFSVIRVEQAKVQIGRQGCLEGSRKVRVKKVGAVWDSSSMGESCYRRWRSSSIEFEG